MRVCLLAAFVLFTGSAVAASSPAANDWQLGKARLSFNGGTTPGIAGQDAVHVTGDAGLHGWDASFGALTQRVSLNSWRGQRVRVSLRLKREGDMRAYIYFNVPAGRSLVQKHDSDDWQIHSFVTDVPAGGGSLLINIGLVSKGGVWVDDVAVQAVGSDVALDTTRRVWTSGVTLATYNSAWNNGQYAYSNNFNGYVPPPSKAMSDRR